MRIVYRLDTGRVIEIGKGDHSRFGKDEYGEITLSAYPDGWDAKSMSLNDLKVVGGALALRTKKDWSPEERTRALNKTLKADKHKAAIQALNARPIAGEKTIANLRERMALYEAILDLGG